VGIISTFLLSHVVLLYIGVSFYHYHIVFRLENNGLLLISHFRLCLVSLSYSFPTESFLGPPIGIVRFWSVIPTLSTWIRVGRHGQLSRPQAPCSMADTQVTTRLRTLDIAGARKSQLELWRSLSRIFQWTQGLEATSRRLRDYSLTFHAPLKPQNVTIQVGNHMVVPPLPLQDTSTRASWHSTHFHQPRATLCLLYSLFSTFSQPQSPKISSWNGLIRLMGF
jgi:hypothetical protein